MSHHDKSRAATPLMRHCTERGCRKCGSRGRWLRRRAWRSRKSPLRCRAGRK